MTRIMVSKKLNEAIDGNGRFNISNVDSAIIAQVAKTYVSGANGLLPLYSKEKIAEYFEVTPSIVTKCIDYAIGFRLIKFSTVIKIINNSADNERRHALHKGLTQSEKRYAELIQERLAYFKASFEEGSNRFIYDSVYKRYLGHNTMNKIIGAYGLSPEEFVYLLKRKACVDMTDIEYSLFLKRFYRDFLGTPIYQPVIEFIVNFRNDMADEIAKLNELRHNHSNDTEKANAIRQKLIDYFDSF